jgi:hypothetical protein
MILKKKKSSLKQAKIAPKVLTRFRVKIKSRHPSHSPLRNQLPLLPWRAVVRLGSITPLNRLNRIEINSIQSVKNSSDKLKTKQCFLTQNIKTAPWWTYNSGMSRFCPNGANENYVEKQNLPYPIIAKNRFGSRGSGNYKLDTQEALTQWMVGKDFSRYIFEEYKNYKYEYRFHTNKNGSFYVCRKALIANTPENKKWCMNAETCTWYLSTNEKFFKPNSYNAIVVECIKALHTLGLDFCAFDVRVQGETDNHGNSRSFQDFIIIEGNSAPSLNEIGIQHYIEQIPIIIREKSNCNS